MKQGDLNWTQIALSRASACLQDPQDEARRREAIARHGFDELLEAQNGAMTRRVARAKWRTE